MFLNGFQIKRLSAGKRAFTFIEMMVSMLIFIIAIGLFHMSYSTGNISFRETEAKINAQRAARQAMENMVRELRGATNVAITQDSDSAQISFAYDSYGTIVFAWSNTGSSANQILRNSVKIIGHSISALSFTDNADAITIDLTATETTLQGESISSHLKEKVALRML